jgi:hypothetical protein
MLLGGFPSPIDIDRDYLRFIISHIHPAMYNAKPGEPIPPYPRLTNAIDEEKAGAELLEKRESPLPPHM